MQFVTVTDVVAFTEWLMRNGHWPLRKISYDQYEALVGQFAGASNFVDDAMLRTVKSNMAYKALTGDSRTHPIDTDISFVDTAAYEAARRDAPTMTEFIARYAAAPNHALLLATDDRHDERQIREQVDRYRPLLDTLLGKILDLYVAKSENAYQTLRKLRFVLNAGDVGFEEMPALLIWSSKAHVAISLRSPDDAILRIRKVMTVLDGLNGPLTAKAAAALKEEIAPTISASTVSPSNRPSWIRKAALGLMSLLIAIVAAVAGNLAGTRDFMCSVQALKEPCATVFSVAK